MRNYREDAPGRFKTFAAVCVNNKLISTVTAHMRDKNAPMRSYLSLGEDVPEEALASPGDDPEQLLIASEETNARNRQIATLLSPFERQVLRLYLSSYSYDEMSRELGSSSKAVDNALQRVRRKLRSVSSENARDPFCDSPERDCIITTLWRHWQSLVFNLGPRSSSG